ncbi:MAG: sigma-70 family RNA polymerase sigma factor [Myxococcales bacterium]|nr:sigma-70 family RNA polymerase sigma factor [Myxococcales bacterium]
MGDAPGSRPPGEGHVVRFPGATPGRPVDIGRLYDEHGAYLCRVVQRLTGSREASEDIVQEVFLLAYHRRQELEDRQGIRTWLYRVAVNHVRHRRRSFSRYQGMKDRFQQHPDQERRPDGPDAEAERAEQGREVAACVSKLSDKLREVFVLYELEELEGNEISEILEIPINTVWSRLRLARAAFREEWARRARIGGAS